MLKYTTEHREISASKMNLDQKYTIVIVAVMIFAISFTIPSHPQTTSSHKEGKEHEVEHYENQQTVMTVPQDIADSFELGKQINQNKNLSLPSLQDSL